MRGRKNISDTVDMVVVALCADYGRRRRAIAERSVTHRTEMEYRYINFKLLSAAEEIVGAVRAETMILEIGERIGYAYSALSDISEVSYKKKKQEVKENIAKRLHLID